MHEKILLTRIWSIGDKFDDICKIELCFFKTVNGN